MASAFGSIPLTVTQDRILPALAFLAPGILMFSHHAVMILLGLLALCTLLDMRRYRTWSWPVDRTTTILGGAYCLWAGLSTFWEFSPGLALPKAGALTALWLIGSLALVGGDDRQSLPRLMIALCAGLWLAALLMVEEYFSVCFLSRFFWSAAHHWAIAPEDQFSLARFKPAAMGMVIWGMIPVGWALMSRRVVLGMATLGLLVIVSIKTGSHGALLGLGTAVVVGPLVLRWRRLGLGMISVFAIIIMATAPLAALLPSSQGIYEAIPSLPSSAHHRLMIWRFAAQKTLERPILGWGFDASRAIPGGEDNFLMYYTTPAITMVGTKAYISPIKPAPATMLQQQMPLHPHNFAEQIWLETGAVGVLLTIVLLLSLVRLIATLPVRYAAVLGAVLSSSLVIAMVSFGIWQSWWQATLWIGAVFAVRFCPIRDDKGPASV